MDIFDQIHQESTGTGQPDIFDQIHQESIGAQQPDIFDEIDAEKEQVDITKIKIEPTPEDTAAAKIREEQYGRGQIAPPRERKVVTRSFGAEPTELPPKKVRQAQQFAFEQEVAPTEMPGGIGDIYRHGMAALTKTAEASNVGVASFLQKLADINQYILDKEAEDQALEEQGIPRTHVTGISEAKDIGEIIAHTIPPDLIEKAAQFVYDKGQYWHKKAQKMNAGALDDLIGESIGGAAPGIGEFMLNVPWASLSAAAEAHKKGDNEAWAALKAGGERYVIGKIFHLLNQYPKIMQVPGMGAAFGGQAMIEGAPPEEAIKSVVTGMGYGMVGGRKKKGKKEAIVPRETPKISPEVAPREELAPKVAPVAEKAAPKPGSLEALTAERPEIKEKIHEVVAPEIKPIIAYHGTRNKFEEFQPLSHFGTEQAAKDALLSVKGSGEQRIIKKQLDIKNPLEVTDTSGTGAEEIIAWTMEAKGKGVLSESEAEMIENIYFENLDKGTELFIKKLTEKGYDGLKYINKTEDPGSISWIPFSNKQIKVTETTEIEQELGGEVDRIMDEIGQKGAIEFRTPVRKIEVPKFEDKESEARFEEAKGVRAEPLLSRAVSVLEAIKNKATREYAALPPGPKYAQLRFDLRTLSKQKGISTDRTLRALQGITIELEKPEFDAFRRKVILDDLAYTAEKDMQLPFGLTKESLQQELSKIDTVVGSSPEIQRALDKRKRMWSAVKNEYINSMKDVGFDVADRFKNEDYFRHQVLEYVNLKGIVGTGRRLGVPAKRGFLKRREGSQLDINTDYLQAEYEVMAQMLTDIKIAKVLKTIDEQHNVVDQIKALAKEMHMDDWRDAIPEDHQLWQPREGSVFYQADAIPAKFAEELTMGQLKELPITDADIKKILALGGKRKQWVLPNEVVETLDNLTKPSATDPIRRGSRTLLRGWKVWQLISPRRFFKYNVRNLTGDADGAFAGNPVGFTKVPQAIKELYALYGRGKTMSPNLKDWFERGGMESTLQAQEMGDINNLKIFRNFLDKNGELKNLSIGLWKKYWKAARLSTDFREAILRYANYLDYLESMEKSPLGRPKNFGASKSDEIMALADVKDRAFELSNDLLGAYDKIGELGKTLREHWIPFWSWKEVNFKRYFQLYKNAVNDGKLAEYIGKRALRHVATSPYTAYRIGKLTLKVLAFAGMTQAWNYLRFPKEERELSQNVRNRPHIILGRDKNGKIIYFSRLGAVTDLLEWVGLDNAPEYLNDYLSGKMSLKNIAKEMAKSPINVIVSGASPFVKTPAELLAKQSYFPDAFRPRAIRDEGLYLARSLGLENEYVAISGLPSRGYAESLGNIFWYKSDPGQAAFGDVMDSKQKFLKKIGKASTGFWITPRGNAAYHWKLALRYGDKDAAKKYVLKYFAMGGTKQGIQATLESMNPLHGMKKEDIIVWVNSMDKKERMRLAAALKFHTDVIMGRKIQEREEEK